MGNAKAASRYVAATILAALAVTRALADPSVAQRFDETFFILIGVGLALILFPLERLKSLKAGGVELALNQPEIQGALTSLNLDTVQDRSLRSRLALQEASLPIVHGSRVLWIDDRPEKVVAVRRMLRALGVETVAAASTDAANQILAADTDFDLMVTDVQRYGTSHETTGGTEIHEGVNYVVLLRSNHPDPMIRSLPVIFYAAYDWERLVEFTRPARELSPSAEISNSAEHFIPAVLNMLAEARTQPVDVAGPKGPSFPRRDA